MNRLVVVAEECLESRVLPEVVLDLADDVTGPGVDPALGEAVVDLMHGMIAHDDGVIGTGRECHMGRPAYPVPGIRVSH